MISDNRLIYFSARENGGEKRGEKSSGHVHSKTLKGEMYMWGEGKGECGGM